MRAHSSIPVVLGSTVSIAAAWWYLTAPGRSPVTALADLGALVSGTIALSAAQRSMATVISSEFGTAGYGWLANAAIANAYAESRLDPAAVGDGVHSVGLFQLHDAGAGEGMSTEARMDPVLNTRRILDEVRGSHGNALRAVRGTATHATLAALFARHIERCWACGYGGGDSELPVREALVSKLFGPVVAATVPH